MADLDEEMALFEKIEQALSEAGDLILLSPDILHVVDGLMDADEAFFAAAR